MNENMKKLLIDTPYLSLSTVCEDGSPYGTWLRFASDGKYLYFDNVPSSAHIANIKRDARVFVTILNLSGKDSISGYIKSCAEIITGDEADKATKLLKERGATPDPNNGVVCRVRIGEIDRAKKVKNPERQFYFVQEGPNEI